MAMSRVYTVAFQGIEAREVDVQVRISRGNPYFTIVGLADKAVGESRERMWAALSAIGLALPPERITVNLAPADLPKEGSHYDLPITLAILAAMGVLPAREMAGYVALGELSLDATLAPVAGVLPAALAASEAGRGLICPAASGAEAAWSIISRGRRSCAHPCRVWSRRAAFSPILKTSRARKPRNARSRLRRPAATTC
jgi:magnesium chelatase family protein